MLGRKFSKPGKDRARNGWLPKVSLIFFKRPKLSLAIWLIIAVFGIASYSTFLKREGFPSVNIPFGGIYGTYLVNDPDKVDAEVAKPLSELILKQSQVKHVESRSYANFTTIYIEYESGVESAVKTPQIEKIVRSHTKLPKQANLQFIVPRFGFTERGDDMVISFYANDKNQSTLQIFQKAKAAEKFLHDRNLSLVSSLSIIEPYVKAVNPVNGKQTLQQKYFDRYGERQGNQNVFYPAVSIGISSKKGADLIDLDKQVRSAVNELNKQPQFRGYKAALSATYAPDIKDQINELQRALFEGLLAALVIGALVIALRASLITVISMVTVILITLAILFLTGYSLNTITLFALILSLALIVDDTIIMVEAIDAQRRRTKDSTVAVKKATSKISRAMIAATSTAVLSFAPLIFVGSFLGDIIRPIPITVIIGLLTSLVVALIFIPTFSRYLLLGKKQMGEGNIREVAAGLEAKAARFIGRPLLWAKNSRKRLWSAGIVALIIGLGFIMAGGYLFSKVTFNIFPPTKDSNGMMINLTFPDGATIEQAEKYTDQVDTVIAKIIGSNFKSGGYYSSGTNREALMQVLLVPYAKRDMTAPQIVDQLQSAIDKQLPKVKAKVSQIDVGPPSEPFTVQIRTNDKAKAYKLARDMAAFLQKAELVRVSGEKAKITATTVGSPDVATRADNHKFVAVTAEFEDSDTSTLVTLAQNTVKKEFTKERLATYGLPKEAVNFDIGQESENQDSFKTLLIAFPALLFAIYLLLAYQFRSLLQPLLIFMAIPFSLFGITLGLYLSDNAFSFFAMLGFFALLGLSIKNTILLTDYANQAKAAGMRPADAAHEALQERFRPLIATSFTAVVALIPLAITSPFWEGLMIVLIGGLLSSTFLVITVFPYYYLGAEYLRSKIRRRSFFIWAIANIVVFIVLSKLSSPGSAFLTLLVLNIALVVYRFLVRRHK